METRPLLFFYIFARTIYNDLYGKEVRFMTYKQIEASRELRLWIGQVIVPAVSVTAVVLANPDVRNAAKQKLDSIKQKFQTKKIRVV